MTTSDSKAVSRADKTSRFFVLGSFALMGLAALLMGAGGIGILLVSGHPAPAYVLASGAGLYAMALLLFVVGVISGVLRKSRLVEAPA